MDVVFYLDHKYNDEEFNFILTLTNEFIDQHHGISLFVTEDGCYQISSMMDRFKRNMGEKGNKVLNFYINNDEISGLGLAENIKDLKSDLFSITKLESKQFNQLLLETSTCHEVRYIRL
jgi:hypothetical protein